MMTEDIHDIQKKFMFIHFLLAVRIQNKNRLFMDGSWVYSSSDRSGTFWMDLQRKA